MQQSSLAGRHLAAILLDVGLARGRYVFKQGILCDGGCGGRNRENPEG
jgi:hypothetical protein